MSLDDAHTLHCGKYVQSPAGYGLSLLVPDLQQRNLYNEFGSAHMAGLLPKCFWAPGATMLHVVPDVGDDVTGLPVGSDVTGDNEG